MPKYLTIIDSLFNNLYLTYYLEMLQICFPHFWHNKHKYVINYGVAIEILGVMLFCNMQITLCIKINHIQLK